MPSAKQSEVDVTGLSPATLRALVILVQFEDKMKSRYLFKGIWASHFARLMWPNSPAWGKHTGNRSGLWQRAGALLWKMYRIGLAYEIMAKDGSQHFWRARETARRGIESMGYYKCPDSDNCKVAWDSYNSNGDCLNK